MRRQSDDLASTGSKGSAMSGPLSATCVDVHEVEVRLTHPGSARFKLTGMMLVAALILAVAHMCSPSKPVRAGDGLQASPSAPAPDPVGQSGFVAEIRWTLKKQHDQMIGLANRLIRRSDGYDNLVNQRTNQQITVESAVASFINAQLTREVAEIAVVEYEQGVFRQDIDIAEGERRLAESDLSRARDVLEFGKAQLAKIKQASKGSTADLANEFRVADFVIDAERRLPRSELAFRQAESKPKMLEAYTKPKRIKELQSEVAKARSVELAKQAVSELEKSKLKRLEQAIKGLDLPDRKAWDLLNRQALASLDRAMLIESQLRIKLDQGTKDGKPDEPLRHEIQVLSNQLQALVDQAAFDESAAGFDEWKPRIHAAAN